MYPHIFLFRFRNILVSYQAVPLTFYNKIALMIVSICSEHVGCVLCLLNRTDCYVGIRRKNLLLFVFEMHLYQSLRLYCR